MAQLANQYAPPVDTSGGAVDLTAGLRAVHIPSTIRTVPSAGPFGLLSPRRMLCLKFFFVARSRSSAMRAVPGNRLREAADLLWQVGTIFDAQWIVLKHGWPHFSHQQPEEEDHRPLLLFLAGHSGDAQHYIDEYYDLAFAKVNGLWGYTPGWNKKFSGDGFLTTVLHHNNPPVGFYSGYATFSLNNPNDLHNARRVRALITEFCKKTEATKDEDAWRQAYNNLVRGCLGGKDGRQHQLAPAGWISRLRRALAPRRDGPLALPISGKRRFETSGNPPASGNQNGTIAFFCALTPFPRARAEAVQKAIVDYTSKGTAMKRPFPQGTYSARWSVITAHTPVAFPWGDAPPLKSGYLLFSALYDHSTPGLSDSRSYLDAVLKHIGCEDVQRIWGSCYGLRTTGTEAVTRYLLGAQLTPSAFYVNGIEGLEPRRLVDARTDLDVATWFTGFVEHPEKQQSRAAFEKEFVDTLNKEK